MGFYAAARPGARTTTGQGTAEVRSGLPTGGVRTGLEPIAGQGRLSGPGRAPPAPRPGPSRRRRPLPEGRVTSPPPGCRRPRRAAGGGPRREGRRPRSRRRASSARAARSTASQACTTSPSSLPLAALSRWRSADAPFVHDVVDDGRRDDLPPQRVKAEVLGVRLAHRRREVGRQERLGDLAVGQGRGEEARGDPVLDVPEHHAEKRTRQPAVARGAREELVLRRHRVVAAPHDAARDEVLDEPDEVLVPARAAQPVEREGQRLARVVGEDEPGDLVRHLREDPVAVRPRRDDAPAHEEVQEDLDVDLVVRHVDAARSCPRRRCSGGRPSSRARSGPSASGRDSLPPRRPGPSARSR